MQRSQVLATFNHLTNVIGPRLTASPAHKQAAEYSRDKLAEWGASNARLEAFEFGRGWSLDQLTLEMVAPRYFPVTGYPEAWTPSMKSEVTGKVVYVGDKSVEQIQNMGDQLRGAIVLLTQPQAAFVRADRLQPSASPEPVRIGAPPMPRASAATVGSSMQRALQAAGVSVQLRPSAAEHGTMFVLGQFRTTNTAIPSIIVAAEHYNMLVHLVANGNAPEMRVNLRTTYHESDSNSYNVLAEIPGSDPVLGNEVVLLGAHLDSWHSSTGATDNADGSAVAMEAMRILKAVGAAPRRTVRVALWSGEEEGLLGSTAYARQHYAGEANAARRDSLVVYLNDDPGSGPTYGFYMENNAAAKSLFDSWLEPLKDLGVKQNVIQRIGNTDHLSFMRLGIPGFTAIKDYADYDVRTHHTNTDFFERVTEADLKQSAVVLAIVAYNAASISERVPR
jgi:hypothetical protein